jgi:Zn-dependent protease
MGRITLNPLVHIDPFGTILMPVLQLFSMGVPVLAWAKPTPVEPSNFKRGWFGRGHVLVWGAGPAVHFVLALAFTGALVLFFQLGGGIREGDPIFNTLRAGIVMNVFLGVFNLVPLPPFDGAWVVSWALPRNLAEHYDRIVEPYGQFILLILFATGGLAYITSPLNNLILGVLSRLIER